ncbi:choice-of-anchor J domain-containing protein [Flavobacterium urocaniciphilum]|uniref:Uncharacterized protein n=1 Tax=Flavobacterium urocaniciphilum TaxID=1299341 RepID=A0A1H9E3A1_9FLAO|nr:choice-of-anchor J domain-containing protein [Flavobacterium urocaniciphilum]SEQ20065.1 protein of unknown function [Flavobacterium urocaniciphilum]
MKNIFLKITFVAIALVSFTSCDEDQTDIPPFFNYTFNENFSSSPTGSGSVEVPIALTGWVNHNASTSIPASSRLWHARTFSSDNYAEFSSFYSTAGTNDVAWLITPAIDLTSGSGEILSFTTKTRFSNGYPMTAFISTDYDGTTAGIATATWIPLTFTIPTADDVITSSGNIDLSGYDTTNARIAFKYTGSKAGVTTTCQLDNIKITKN